MSREGDDWTAWMRDLGMRVRRVREFLGLSQMQLAHLSGVSQGAVSRLEAGRGRATPILIVLKVLAPIVESIAAFDPAAMTPDLHRLRSLDEVLVRHLGGLDDEGEPITGEADVDDLVRLYRRLPRRQRSAFVSVARAVMMSLAKD